MPVSPPQRHLLLADYLVLEDRFVHAVRERKADDPFAAVRVLVPTAMLRRHLRGVLTERLGGHLNVEFVTLDEVVRETAAPVLAAEGDRLLPQLESGLGAEMLLGQVVRERAGERGFYFAPIADKPGFHRALAGTIADLVEGRVNSEEFDYAIHHGAVDRHVSSRKLLDLLAIWRRYEDRLKETKFVDSAGLAVLSIIHLAAQEPPPGLTVVYGFYDLNELQKLLVLTWCGDSDALVLFPRDAGPAFNWTDDLRAWFESVGFVPDHHAHAGAGRRAPVLQHHAVRLFATPDGETGENAGELKIISAPGEAREAREIAREILSAVGHDPTLRFSDIAVVPRSLEAYRQVVTEAFSAAGIPLNATKPPPLADTSPGRAALLLAELVQRDFPRAKVMELATGFDLAIGEEAAPELWDLLTLKAAIAGGAAEWRDRLSSLPEAATHLAKRSEDENEVKAPLREDYKAAAAQAQAFVRRLLRFGDKLREAKRFTDATVALSSCLLELLAPTNDLGRVVAAVAALSSLDSLVGETDLATFVRTMERLLSLTPDRAEESDHGGVVFADIMALRGASFRVVFVPGLVEKGFPLPARQDPLLLDYDRRRLNDVLAGVGTGGMLPAKKTRVAEEKLLYRLACGIATERLVLSYPRLDPGAARERVASHFLLRTVEALTGQRATQQALETYPGFARVPLSRLPPEDLSRSVDGLEFDLGQVAGAVQSGRAGAALYLKQLSRHFERGVRAERNRWGERRFTAWDGMLASQEALAVLHLAKRRYLLEANPRSPSALETFGTCPYRYLLSRVFELDVLEEPERLHTISPADRGELIHTILERFHESLREDDAWPPPPDAEERLSKLTEAELRRFAQVGATGFPLFWELAKQTIREDLRTVLELEQTDAGEWRPELLECKYGRDEQATGAPAIELGDGNDIQFSGRIDRVDLDTAKQRARVVDYKTGRKLSLKPDSFAGGTSLQLPLYLIAAEHLLAERKPVPELDRALFWYVSTKGGFGRVEFTTADWGAKLKTLKHILCTFADCARVGSFFAVPDETKQCRYCDFALVCGAGKEQVFNRKQHDPCAAAYLELSEIE